MPQDRRRRLKEPRGWIVREAPSHGVEFINCGINPDGFRFYYKRLKLIIGWELRDPTLIQSGKWEVFYFAVFNPDLAKH